MILAYDEGAWHPDGNLLLLVVLLSIAALVPLYRLAKGEPWRLPLLLALVLPFVATFAFIAYFDFGNSGAYTGNGSLGGGARIDLVASLGHALPYFLYLLPILLLLALGSWRWLRTKVPWLFWLTFAFGAVLQLLFSLAFILVWFER